MLDALAGDPGLSERQKQVLVDIYESFRRGNAATEGAPDAVSPDALSPDVVPGPRPAGSSAATGTEDVDVVAVAQAAVRRTS